MSVVLETTRVTGSSETEVVQNLKDAITRYDNLLKTEKKVIFYRFASQIRPLDFKNWQDNGAIHANDEVFSNGVGLDLWFQVGYVLTSPKENNYHTGNELYLNADHEEADWRWNKTLYMDFDESRLLFLVSFREYLVQGITRMQDFFKQDNLPKMMEAIVNQNALPFKNAELTFGEAKQ